MSSQENKRQTRALTEAGDDQADRLRTGEGVSADHDKRNGKPDGHVAVQKIGLDKFLVKFRRLRNVDSRWDLLGSGGAFGKRRRRTGRVVRQ